MVTRQPDYVITVIAGFLTERMQNTCRALPPAASVLPALQARWLRGLAAAACVAMLAGCGGMTLISGPHPADPLCFPFADDPIGALIAYQYTHNYKRGGHSRNAMLSEALSQLGTPYRFGGDSPATGFDCSGLVAYSAEHSLGLKLPRNSAAQATLGAWVDRNQLRPGDLVFFNTTGHPHSHVGIYLGADRFVHSPTTGGVVRIDDLTVAYWDKRYEGARRLALNMAAGPAPLQAALR
jgi:hypothetical protein